MKCSSLVVCILSLGSSYNEKKGKYQDTIILSILNMISSDIARFVNNHTFIKWWPFYEILNQATGQHQFICSTS